MYLILNDDVVKDLSPKSKLRIPHHYDVPKSCVFPHLPNNYIERKLIIITPSRQTHQSVIEILDYFAYELSHLPQVDLSDKGVRFSHLRVSLDSFAYFFFDKSSGLYSMALNKNHFTIYEHQPDYSLIPNVVGRNQMVLRFKQETNFSPAMVHNPTL